MRLRLVTFNIAHGRGLTPIQGLTSARKLRANLRRIALLLDRLKPDVVALQVVTVGQRSSDVAREWFAADRYQDYLHLHGLSVEAAEGLAELIHKQIRGELGISGDDARDMRDLFKQGYRGSRYSFGYPACPNLEDQEILLDLLGAQRIGITLSDEFQLVPEQSTSALVCHHPAAKYFSI